MNPTQPTFPESLDSTMLSAFGSCPQKFLIEFCYRKAPTGRSIHLHAGGAFAAAMETLRIAHYQERLAWDDCLDKAFFTFARFWGDFEAPEREYKDFINMWSAIIAYTKEYPLDTDHFQPLMLADGKPAVEFKFSIPMMVPHPTTGNPLMFSGRIDLLSADENGLLYTVDEKTTKSLGASWQYQWDMRGQFFGYNYAARSLGYNVGGALVRGIAIQQTQFGFQEKPVFFTTDQLNGWWLNMNRRAARMSSLFQSALVTENFHDTFEKSYGEACTSYGNCVYQSCCRSPEPWLIYDQYETRVWNPLAKDPTAESEDRLSELEKLSLAEFMGE